MRGEKFKASAWRKEYFGFVGFKRNQMDGLDLIF